MNSPEINLDHVQKVSSDTVKVERLLPGPIDRIWGYLVDPAKRRLWFADGSMPGEVGEKATLTFNHSVFADEPTPEKYKEMDAGGISFDVEITRFEPPHHLAFTWPNEGNISEVQFDLSGQDGKVRLVLTHTRLKDVAEMADVSSGWHAHLTVLADVLNGRQSKGFWSHARQLEEHYRKAFGA